MGRRGDGEQRWGAKTGIGEMQGSTTFLLQGKSSYGKLGWEASTSAYPPCTDAGGWEGNSKGASGSAGVAVSCRLLWNIRDGLREGSWTVWC